MLLCDRSAERWSQSWLEPVVAARRDGGGISFGNTRDFYALALLGTVDPPNAPVPYRKVADCRLCRVATGPSSRGRGQNSAERGVHHVVLAARSMVDHLATGAARGASHQTEQLITKAGDVEQI